MVRAGMVHPTAARGANGLKEGVPLQRGTSTAARMATTMTFCCGLATGQAGC